MALGKGLSALISRETEVGLKNSYIPDLPVNEIFPNPYQPRIEIKPETLMDLADSIRNHGIIEPLIVTKKSDKHYELIAGERRWRAAKMAKVSTVPAVVKEATPQEMLEIAIIENIKRKDLNPLEEAMAFENLMSMFNMTQDDIAKKLNIGRPSVANKVRLLELPKEIKKYLLEGRINEGHARALMGLNSTEAMLATAAICVRDQLSVRAVEELVRRLTLGAKPMQKNMRILDGKTQEYEEKLQGKFGDRVKLFRTHKGGKIIIPFENDNELQKIYKSMLG
jgi:ParB family chromosome partitioning protein